MSEMRIIDILRSRAAQTAELSQPDPRDLGRLVPLQEPQRAIVFGTKPESSVKTPVIAAEEAKPTAAAATTSTTKEQSTTGTAAANVTAATSTPANAGGGNARQASDASATAIDIAGAAKAAAALVDVENYEADEQVAVALTLEKSDARAAAIAGGGAQAGAVSGAQAGAGGGAQAGAGGGGSGGARRRLLDTEDDEALQTLLPLLQLDGSLTIPALLAATAPLAHCLKKAMHQSDLSISPDADQVSDECELEVRDFYISRNADVRHDLPLVGLCAADLATWCSQGTSPTKMMECLKERKEMLKPRCKGAVAQRQMDAAEDISLVPELNAACGDDRARHCKTAGWGEGAALACLLELWRKTPSSLNPNCSHGLMTYMAEQAEDIRFNFKLAASCSLDKQVRHAPVLLACLKFCRKYSRV